MKKLTTFFAVTAIAALSLTGQALAKGSMGGSQGRSSMASPMATAQHAGGANGMQRGGTQGSASAPGTTSRQGTMNGTAAMGMNAVGQHSAVPPATAQPAGNQ